MELIKELNALPKESALYVKEEIAKYILEREMKNNKYSTDEIKEKYILYSIYGANNLLKCTNEELIERLISTFSSQSDKKLFYEDRIDLDILMETIAEERKNYIVSNYPSSSKVQYEEMAILLEDDFMNSELWQRNLYKYKIANYLSLMDFHKLDNEEIKDKFIHLLMKFHVGYENYSFRELLKELYKYRDNLNLYYDFNKELSLSNLYDTLESSIKRLEND